MLPTAGLMAAPGALVGYALVGTSRTLVVGATTATAALSASAVGPLANGDAERFVQLSAALAVVTAVVLVCSGLLRLGAVADLISKPVMTGFLFGLGLTIAVGQLPKVLGVDDPGGDFFPRLWGVLGELGDIQPATAAVGGLSIVLLVVLRRVMPAVPGVLVVLVLSILVSWLFDLKAHGVDVVGTLPSALPDPSIPDLRDGDIAALIGTGFGVVFLSTEGIGVARGLLSDRRAPPLRPPAPDGARAVPDRARRRPAARRAARADRRGGALARALDPAAEPTFIGDARPRPGDGRLGARRPPPRRRARGAGHGRAQRRPASVLAPALGARRVERVLGAVGVGELALAVVVVDEQAQRRTALPAATLGGHAIDEADDRGAGRSVVPGCECSFGADIRRVSGGSASPARVMWPHPPSAQDAHRSHRRAVRQANSGGARERSRSNRLSQPRDGP